MERVKPNSSDYNTKHVIFEEEKPKENLIIKQKKSDSKPFPILLNDLKRPLQQKAYELDMSLHGLCKKILRAYVEGTQLGG